MLPVASDRDLFTRCGLHLKAKRKEHTAVKGASRIKDLFNIEKKLPIALEWKAKENNNSGVN
jgi:hypothetical protein